MLWPTHTLVYLRQENYTEGTSNKIHNTAANYTFHWSKLNPYLYMLYTRLIIHNCSKSFLSATKSFNSLLCIMTLEVKYKITSANHCLIAGRTMVVTSLSKHPTILIAFEDYHTCAENRIKSGDKSQRSNDKI